MKRHVLLFALSLGVLLVDSSAGADEPTKQACIAANESAQDLQSAGHFDRAREQLTVCMAESCPGPVREDCSQRLAELQRLQPTIVFVVKDSGGHDLDAVAVTVDGRPPAYRLDGRELRVDPGEHTFTFEAAGRRPVTQTFVLEEGQKERRERIVMGLAMASSAPTSVPSPSSELSSIQAPRSPLALPAPATPSPPTETALPAEVAPSPGSGQRIAGLAVGTAGVLGVAIGTIFGLKARSDWSSAQKACGSPAACPSYSQGVSDHGRATSAASVSTVGFVAAGALLAGGLVLYFTAPSISSTPTVGLVPGIGTVTLRGGFE